MTPAARAQIEGTIKQLQALLDADCDCPEADPTTVRELWDRYLETLPAEKWVKSVVSTTKPLLGRIGELLVGKLKPTHWEDYRDAPETRERYSSTTRNIQLKRMKTCLTWALDTGRITVNPWARVKLERGKPKRETEISAEGEAAVLALFDPMMQAFFLVAIDAGMRREEIRLLEWQDIDRDGKKIRIPASRTKTRKERIGRLTTRALDALMRITPVPGCPYVFVNPDTRLPWSQVHIWSLWREAADLAGLKPADGDGAVRFHDTRGTMISRAVRSGATIPAIQNMVGHSSLQTTARYIRVQGKDVDEAAALLEAHLLLSQHQRKGPQRAPGAHKVDSIASKATG